MMRKVLMGFGAVCLATAASAQDATDMCEIKDASDQISVLVCAPGLDDAELSIAGEAACGTRKPCGAWVWEDENNAPENAPEGHAGLTETEVRTATGVFVAEDSIFIRIEPES